MPWVLVNLNNQLNQQGVLFFYDEVLHYRWTCEQTAFYTQSKISAWIYYILMEFNKKKGGEMIDTGTHFRWIIWLNSTFPWQPCQHIIEHSGQQLTSMYLLQCMLCLTVRNVAIVTVLYIFTYPVNAVSTKSRMMTKLHLPCECYQDKQNDGKCSSFAVSLHIFMVLHHFPSTVATATSAATEAESNQREDEHKEEANDDTGSVSSKLLQILKQISKDVILKQISARICYL